MSTASRTSGTYLCAAVLGEASWFAAWAFDASSIPGGNDLFHYVSEGQPEGGTIGLQWPHAFGRFLYANARTLPNCPHS